MSRIKDLEGKINCTERKIARLNRRGMYSLEAQRLQDLLEMLREELEGLRNETRPT